MSWKTDLLILLLILVLGTASKVESSPSGLQRNAVGAEKTRTLLPKGYVSPKKVQLYSVYDALTDTPKGKIAIVSICGFFLILLGLFICRWQRWQCRRVWLAMGAVVLGLGVSEGLLRVIQVIHPFPFLTYGSYSQFRGVPHGLDWNFKLNSRGFKDVEFTDKQAGQVRILAVGDSFAYGVVPYEYNYLTRLETQLQKKWRNVELYNMGIPGTGPRQYVQLLKDEGFQYQPDIILVNFFVGNDFLDSLPDRKLTQPSSYLYLARLFKVIPLLLHYSEMEMNPVAKKYCDGCGSIPADLFYRIEGLRSFIYVKDNSRFKKALTAAVDYIDEINRMGSKSGAKVIVALLPSEIQTSRRLQRIVKNRFHPELPWDDWDLEQPNRMLMAALAKKDIPWIDLLPGFREKGKAGKVLYRLRDTHWNIAGNQLAVEILNDRLTKLLNLDKKTISAL